MLFIIVDKKNYARDNKATFIQRLECCYTFDIKKELDNYLIVGLFCLIGKTKLKLKCHRIF